MPRLEIGPVFVPHVKVGIDGLHGQESAQAPAAPPAHHHVDAGNIFRAQPAVLEPGQIPFPAVVDEQVNLHAVSLARPELRERLGKLGRSFVAHHQQRGAAPRNFESECHGGIGKSKFLSRGAAGVVLCKAINRGLHYSPVFAYFIQGKPGIDPVGVSFLPGQAVIQSPAAIAVRNEADMERVALSCHPGSP